MTARQLEAKFQAYAKKVSRWNKKSGNNYAMQYYLDLPGVGDPGLLPKKERLTLWQDFLDGNFPNLHSEDVQLCKALYHLHL